MVTAHENVSLAAMRSGNGTASRGNIDLQPYFRVAAGISFTLFVLIVSLNLLVIYTLQFRTKQKSRLFFFIFHLAIADLLVGLVSVLGEGILNSLNHAWYAGNVPCKIYWYLHHVVIVASNNLLIGLSIDRFLAIKSPLKVLAIGSKLNKALVFGSWIISFAVYTFLLHFYQAKGNDCRLRVPNSFWKPYVYSVASLVFLLPAIVITICYVGICSVIWSRWKKGFKMAEKTHGESKDMLQTESKRNGGVISKAKIKSLKLTFIVCLAFFLCWTPMFAIYLMEFTTARVSQPVFVVMKTLYPLNSACNPIIFIIFNWKLFSPRIGQTSEIPSTASQMTTV